MKNHMLLSPLVFAGSLLLVLTTNAQSQEFNDSLSEPSPSMQTAPAKDDEPSLEPPAESTLEPRTPALANPAPEQPQTLVSSTTVVGAKVKNAQGETIGDIQEIMIDPTTGSVTYAVVTSSGQWGMGKQKSFAVPWTALKIAFNHTEVVVELEADKLSLPTHIELSQQ